MGECQGGIAIAPQRVGEGHYFIAQWGAYETASNQAKIQILNFQSGSLPVGAVRSLGMIRDRFLFLRNTHGIERAINKDQCDDKKESADANLQDGIVHLDSNFRGQQTKDQRRES